MYDKLLIPLDGSKTAEAVLPYARSLSRKLKFPVTLLTVIDTSELSRSVSAADGLYLDRLVEDETQRSAEYLAKIGETFVDGAVALRTVQGRAAEVIIESAADKGALIMMATHGRSGLKRFLLGSVTEKVLRGANNPLLLVRADETAPTSGEAALKSVIVPLDGSELAESILPVVEASAQKLDLQVVLFRVYMIPYGVYSAGEGFYDPVNIEAFRSRLRQETIDYLESKAAALTRKGIEKVSYVAKEGLSADEIIKFARATPDNLIVMCSHGYSGAKRWILGSVTETVARHSDNAVLVVRAGSGLSSL
jgi:nucleotide-binding universal stress UspA family protein